MKSRRANLPSYVLLLDFALRQTLCSASSSYPNLYLTIPPTSNRDPSQVFSNSMDSIDLKVEACQYSIGFAEELSLAFMVGFD